MANFFVFVFGIERCRCMFSISMFLESLVNFACKLLILFLLSVVLDVIMVVA